MKRSTILVYSFTHLSYMVMQLYYYINNECDGNSTGESTEIKLTIK